RDAEAARVALGARLRTVDQAENVDDGRPVTLGAVARALDELDLAGRGLQLVPREHRRVAEHPDHVGVAARAPRVAAGDFAGRVVARAPDRQHDHELLRAGRAALVVQRRDAIARGAVATARLE